MGHKENIVSKDKVDCFFTLMVKQISVQQISTTIDVGLW